MPGLLENALPSHLYTKPITIKAKPRPASPSASAPPPAAPAGLPPALPSRLRKPELSRCPSWPSLLPGPSRGGEPPETLANVVPATAASGGSPEAPSMLACSAPSACPWPWPWWGPRRGMCCRMDLNRSAAPLSRRRAALPARSSSATGRAEVGHAARCVARHTCSSQSGAGQAPRHCSCTRYTWLVSPQLASPLRPASRVSPTNPTARPAAQERFRVPQP